MNKRILIWSGVSAGVLLVLGGVALAYHVDKQPVDVFLSRLSFRGEPITETNVEEFMSRVRSDASEFLTQPVEWQAETGSLVLSPEQMGFSVKLESVESQLEAIDESLWAKLSLSLKKQELGAPSQVILKDMKAAFEGSGIEQGMKEANYFYENGVQISPQQTGYGIEYEILALDLGMRWLKQEDSASHELPMRVKEAKITAEFLETYKEKVAALTERGLTLQDSDGSSWTLSLKDHLDWLVPGEESFTLNEAAFYSFLRDEIAPEVEVEAQSVVITETDGDYHFEGSARVGRKIDYEASLALMETAINTENTEPVVLTVNEVEPEITVPESLATLGVTDLLGFGYSDFSGSPTNRVHNVNHGMNIFNGTLLAPGEEFSFTSLMGPIDAAHGWYPELVIKGDETIPEYGGGLCQVSSTMFRAALLTGMPITQRRNHSYAVSYYAYPDGYGLDATIYDPQPDFRFVNDTAGHMLIQGYTDGASAYFVFYGTNDGRSVTMEKGAAYDYRSIGEPQITYTDKLAPGERVLESYAHTGFKIDWWRTITYADGTVSERENFHSNYEARPAKYLEGNPAEAAPEVL